MLPAGCHQRCIGLNYMTVRDDTALRADLTPDTATFALQHAKEAKLQLPKVRVWRRVDQLEVLLMRSPRRSLSLSCA